MTLRRYTLGPNGVQIPLDVTIYGVSRNYAPHELIAGSGIVQGDTEVTFAGQQIAAAQWPGPAKKTDVIIFDNRNTVIQAIEPKNFGTDTLVFAAQVRG
jgi:hypothetical protein